MVGDPEPGGTLNGPYGPHPAPYARHHVQKCGRRLVHALSAAGALNEHVTGVEVRRHAATLGRGGWRA